MLSDGIERPTARLGNAVVLAGLMAIELTFIGPMMHAILPSFAIALRSYADDVHRWIATIARGYAVGVGLILAGAIAILVAIGVGIAATFHVIEVRYGASVAYAAVGGVFLIFGLIGLLAGRALLKRPVPLPSPQRQVDMLKRSITAPVAVRLLSNARTEARGEADPVTQLLAATAAAILIGWIVFSRSRKGGAIRD